MTGLTLRELLDPAALNAAVADGYVRRQTHPDEPLAILNYTEKAQYEHVWTPVTMTCRGLIYQALTLEVVARPFPKFFNHGQPGAPALPLYAPAVVTDKLDGSLGILYPLPSGGHAIATRGSFASEQARHATTLWAERFDDQVKVDPAYTLLFEILYPGNRIVVDYGDVNELVLLGAVHIPTGRSLTVEEARDRFDWPGWVTEVFPARTLAAALARPPRPGAEGLVVHLPVTDQRVKLKQDDYVALHRILTGTSARVLWQHLAVNACRHLIERPSQWETRLQLDRRRAEEILAVGQEWMPKLLERVPDEFYAWVRRTVDGIAHAVAGLEAALREHVAALVGEYGADRKAFAAAVAHHPHRGALFLLYDGRDITTYLWLAHYPGDERPFMTRSEDNA